MNRNTLDNFRPQSPISLYSYIAAATGQAREVVPTIAAAQPAEVTVAKTSKSILKNPVTKPPSKNLLSKAKLPVQQHRSRSPVKQTAKQIPLSRPTTPVAPARNNIRQKTVAFGLTTNVSDTVEKKKEASSQKAIAHRVGKPFMATTKEIEEIHKQLKSQKEEIHALKNENIDLKKSLDELRSSETKLSRALTSISARLMDLEKQRHNQSSNASNLQNVPIALPLPEKPCNDGSPNTSQQQIPPPIQQQQEKKRSQQEKQPQQQEKLRYQQEKQRPQQQQQQNLVQYRGASNVASYPGRDEKRIEDFLSFINQRIRESPDFEVRINRTVDLFGRRPDGAAVPTTLPESQRLPLRETSNDANPSGFYGAKYTQRLTLHKEITTFSPDRAHIPRATQNVHYNDDDNFFVDEVVSDNGGEYQGSEGGDNFVRQGPNSSNLRRQRYRRN